MVGSSSSNTLQAACTIQSGVRPTFMDSSAWTFAAAVAAASVSSSLSSLDRQTSTTVAPIRCLGFVRFSERSNRFLTRFLARRGRGVPL